jgi:hypothetical protein
MKLRIVRGQGRTWFLLAPLLFVVGFVPLLVFHRDVPFEGYLYKNFPAWDHSRDFFAWYKSKAVVAGGFLAFLGLLFAYQLRLKDRILEVLVGLLVFSVAASSYLSAYPQIVFQGFPQQYETFSVYIAYLSLFALASRLEWSPRTFFWLGNVLKVSSGIIACVGILEFWGFHPLDRGLLRSLIFPADLLNTPVLLKGEHEARSTLYHPNFLGSYLALVLPLSLHSLFRSKSRNQYVLHLIWFAALLGALIGSHSRAAILGSVLGTGLLVCFQFAELRKSKAKIIHVAIVCAFVIASFALKPNTPLWNRFQSTSQDLGQLGQSAGSDSAGVEEIRIQGQRFFFKAGRDTLAVDQNSARHLEVVDSTPSELLKLSPFQIGPTQGLKVTYSGSLIIDLVATDLGPRILVNGGTHLPDEPSRFRLPIQDHQLSARGYIWSRTLPLIAASPLIGRGPGTYAIDFPQHDYVGKVNAGLGIGNFVDQPHSLYLHWAHAFGIPSLILFLALVGYSLRQFWRTAWATGFACGVVAHLITGLFVAGSIQASPLFWIFLGVTYSLSRRIQGTF